jgi:hypothetical protein
MPNVVMPNVMVLQLFSTNDYLTLKVENFSDFFF